MMKQNGYRKSMIDRLLEGLINNNQTLGLLLIAGAVLGCLYCGHAWWVQHTNKAAQHYFGSLVIEYNNAMNDKAYTEWDMLRTKFEKGFDKHARATVLPYYKNYVVQILLQQNKHNEAEALLDTIIYASKGSSLHEAYVLERALLDIDSADNERHTKGMQVLQTLANNDAHQFKDTAQFYLGRYYWSNDRLDEARDVWQKLVNEYVDEKIAPSPWVQQVKEFLNITIV